MPPETSRQFELLEFSSDKELAAAAANRWLDEWPPAGTGGPPWCVALSGGRIAKTFFTKVVEFFRDGGTPSLPQVHFFWADERCVPPEHPDSNCGLAAQSLLQPLKIAPEQIHRIRGEADPQFARAEAEAELCRIAPLNAAGLPVLDLIFLGMGEDGHVASLFPGGTMAGAAYQCVTAPKPPPERITLSYAVIAAARQVWVLASGPGKAAALAESLAPQGRTPLAKVLQERERTVIFTDIAR